MDSEVSAELTLVDVGNILLPMSKAMAKIVRRVLSDLPCSERQLAIEAGIAPSTLTRIKNGERSATPATVLKLADALAVLSNKSKAAERTLRQALVDEEEEQ